MKRTILTRTLVATLALAFAGTVPLTATTAFAAGNSCIDANVVRYLVDLTPPKNGTAC